MKIKITEADLVQMEQRKRANLINSVGGFKSVCLIGTTDVHGQSNLAIFNSIVHIGANPPLIGFIMRPDSVERHSLFNIHATKSYTINHLNEAIYRQGHQTSAKYPREVSEFNATGLHAEYKENCIAPFVKESNVQMAIEFKQRIDLTINNTILIIGEIKQLFFPENCWQADGFLDIEKAGTIACSGLDSYHTTQQLERLPYAKA